MEHSDGWTCTICTFFNSNRNLLRCETCTSDRPILSPWSCSSCTFSNSPSKERCEICGEPNNSSGNSSMEYSRTSKDPPLVYSDTITEGNKKVKRNEETVLVGGEILSKCPYSGCGLAMRKPEMEEHLSLHQMEKNFEPDEELATLRRRYGMESKPDSGSYAEQYERRLELDWSQNKISKQEMEERKRKVLENIRGPEMYKTWGLLASVRASYEKLVRPIPFYLCDSVDHYNSDKGDSGWGCGYRNIQMMCSYLQQHEAFKKVLFDGCGYIPTIPVLQEWIEAAWSKGFDLEGCKQLGESIFNSKKMIGATDCAAVLRSFGVKANLVDFYSTKRLGISQVQSNVSGFGDKKKKEPLYHPNRELAQWVWRYFEERNKSTPFTPAKKKPFVPPLYLQHDGHSRTIVGIERRGNQYTLIIFDPSHWGSVLRTDLKENKLAKLKKSADTLTKDKYQIVYVEEGFYSPSEMDAAKILNSKKYKT